MILSLPDWVSWRIHFLLPLIPGFTEFFLLEENVILQIQDFKKASSLFPAHFMLCNLIVEEIGSFVLQSGFLLSASP